MGKPKAPKPPDPAKTAAAQTGTNIGTAIANTAMGQVNQITPDGTLTYDQTGTYTYRDPQSGNVYDLPQYTATTALSPEQQAIQEQNRAAQFNLASTANERSEFLKDYLPGTEALTDQIDNKLYELGAERLDPRFSRQEDQLRTRLANQGVVAGSEAWKREMDQFGEGRNDAYNQLMLQGRGQAPSEVNTPINQITALLSGSQVSNPQVAMSSPSQMPTVDYAGLVSNNYNQQLNAYNQQQAQRGSMLGGLFDAGASLGSASIMRARHWRARPAVALQRGGSDEFYLWWQYRRYI